MGKITGGLPRLRMLTRFRCGLGTWFISISINWVIWGMLKKQISEHPEGSFTVENKGTKAVAPPPLF